MSISDGITIQNLSPGHCTQKTGFRNREVTQRGRPSHMYGGPATYNDLGSNLIKNIMEENKLCIK